MFQSNSSNLPMCVSNRKQIEIIEGKEKNEIGKEEKGIGEIRE